jgi:hypothetical protein
MTLNQNSNNKIVICGLSYVESGRELVEDMKEKGGLLGMWKRRRGREIRNSNGGVNIV